MTPQRSGEQITSRIQLYLPFVLFLCLAGSALGEFFVGDEVMNLFTYLRHPHSWWFAGLVKFWSSDYYRPLGGVVDVAIYHIFGFHALPFKIVLFAALLLNMVLLYRFSRMLSGSVQVACWALLLCSYHTAFAALYLNFGTIYDVLGYTFFFCALLLYVAWVSSPDRKATGAVLVILLYLAGLELKEMGVTLPAILLLWNLLFTRALRQERWKWVVRSGLPIWVCFILAVIYTKGKMTGPESLAAIPSYTPHFTLHQYATLSAHYIRQVFYLSSKLPTPAGALWIFALMIAAGALLRSRVMVFCAISIIVTQLPVSFMEPRGGFAIYIPFAFWGLYLAVVLDRVSALLGSPGRAFALWLAAAAALTILHIHMKPVYYPQFTNQAAAYRTLSHKLDDWHLRLGPKSRVLLINDPFPTFWIAWDPMFLINLHAHTTEIVLARLKLLTFLPPEAELAGYDYVIDYDPFGWRLIRRPGEPLIPSDNLRRIAADAAVRLLDGFDPPIQGLWRQTAPVFTIETRSADPGPHSLSVSLVSYRPARLSFQVDDQEPVDKGKKPGPNFDFTLPIPSSSARPWHTVTFHGSGQIPIFLVDAALR